jgi:hypothetical protein
MPVIHVAFDQTQSIINRSFNIVLIIHQLYVHQT